MAKQGQHQPAKASRESVKREQVAEGGKTRASSPRSGRSGSDSNASRRSRGS